MLSLAFIHANRIILNNTSTNLLSVHSIVVCIMNSSFIVNEFGRYVLIKILHYCFRNIECINFVKIILLYLKLSREGATLVEW